MTTALTSAFQWVWQTSLESSLLILLVLAIQMVLRQRLSPRLSYALGLLILVRLVMPVPPPSTLSAFNMIEYLVAADAADAADAAGAGGAPPALESAERDRVIDRAVSPAEFAPRQLVTPEGRNDMRIVGKRREPNWPLMAASVWLCGLGLLVGLTLVRLRKTAFTVRTANVIGDPAMQRLLHECQATMGVRRQVRLLAVRGIETPAVFGLFRPRLLVPVAHLRRLTESELRLVFLHELAHIKRSDVLLNWCTIVLRAVYWYNPLVWLAARKLRADREIVRDQMVLKKLAPADRPGYGHVLLSLVRQSPSTNLCPSLAGALNRKTEIKRRIIMITNFKRPRRLAKVLSGLLLGGLIVVTFTRATTEKQAVSEKTPQLQAIEIQKAPETKRGLTRLDILQSEVDMQRARVEAAQSQLDRLRIKLRIPDLADSDNLTLDPETIRRIEFDRVSADSTAEAFRTRFERLKAMSKTELRGAVPTVSPDDQLSHLLRDLSSAEANLSAKSNLGSEHPEMKSLLLLTETLNQQIDARIDGIVRALSVEAESRKAQATALRKELESARIHDAEKMETYRPYFQAKRDVELAQRFYEMLQLRLLEERVDNALEKSNRIDRRTP